MLYEVITTIQLSREHYIHENQIRPDFIYIFNTVLSCIDNFKDLISQSLKTVLQVKGYDKLILYN